MRILIVEATYHFIEGENNHPSLGLAYLASALRHEFHDVYIKIISSAFLPELLSFKPDLVFITSVTKNYGVAKRCAAIVKGLSNVPVIIGGVHVYFLPETITRDMDIAIMGEGERAVIDIVNYFRDSSLSHEDLKDIPGIAYWDNGELLITEKRPVINNLDDIDYPARDLINVGRHASMITSRGCPYDCAFCSTSRYTGNRARYASAEYVFGEIMLLQSVYQLEYITIYDDMFALNRKRIEDIVELICRSGLHKKIRFAVNLRTDFINDDIARLLKQMNVHAVGLGVESGCQKTLDYLKSGGITVQDNINAVKVLEKHKIIPMCNIIIGSPHETTADLQETVEFMINNKIKHFDMNVLTPYPGTPVWEYAKARGFVSSDMDWKRLYFNLSGNPIILSEHLSAGELILIYQTMIDIKNRARFWRSVWKVFTRPDQYIRCKLGV